MMKFNQYNDVDKIDIRRVSYCKHCLDHAAPSLLLLAADGCGLTL